MRIHSALDLDLGDASSVQLSFFRSCGSCESSTRLSPKSFLSGKPAGVPVFNDAHANAVGIYFLAHCFTSLLFLLSAQRSCGWCASGCGRRGPVLRGIMRLSVGPGQRNTSATYRLLRSILKLFSALAACAVQQLQKGLTSGLRGVLQDRQRFVQGLVTDQIHNDRHLAGRLMRA